MEPCPVMASHSVLPVSITPRNPLLKMSSAALYPALATFVRALAPLLMRPFAPCTALPTVLAAPLRKFDTGLTEIMSFFCIALSPRIVKSMSSLSGLHGL